MDLPVRVLVLCTANSARSQIAEALLRAGGGRRVDVESAGTAPADAVHPGAMRVLAEHDIRVENPIPKGLDAVIDCPWDLVITVCDHARDTCPVLPGHAATVHWGVEDPAGADDEPEAFAKAFRMLRSRIDRFLALPLADLDQEEVVRRAREIGSPTR